MKGNGKGSFFVVTFCFLKSTKILNFSFFFGTITINDNHHYNKTMFFYAIFNVVFYD
jgi:hypothetical protein